MGSVTKYETFFSKVTGFGEVHDLQEEADACSILFR